MPASPRKTAEDLRRSFNQTFARPHPEPRGSLVELLVVRAGEHLLALRSSDMLSVLKCPPLTPVPSGAAELAGIAAVRGTIVGMYSLSALIDGAPVTSKPEWAVLCGDGSIGLLFDSLERYLQVEEDSIYRPDGERRHSAREVVKFESTHVAVVHVPSHLEHIMSRSAQPVEPRKRTP